MRSKSLDPTFVGGPLLQRKCNSCSKSGGASSCPNCSKDDDRNLLQRKANSDRAVGEVPPIVYDVLRSPGQALDTATRAFFEPRFGHDFSRVRVHAGPLAEASAKSVDAVAYTVGSHIVIGDESIARGSSKHMELLAHELTHAVQNSSQPSLSLDETALTIGQDSAPQELEARRTSNSIFAHATFDSRNYPSGLSRTLRRQRRNESNGGCGVCEPPNVTGTRVHSLLTALFYLTYRGIVPEATVPNPDDGENGRLDLMQIRREPTPPHVISIGEIKPDNDRGRRDGKRDLIYYRQAVQRLFPSSMFTVGFLDIPAPSVSLPYLDPLAKASCAQSLSVRNTKIGGQPGLYLCSCDPPRSQLSKDCCIPEPDPVFVPSPQSSDVEEKKKEKQTQPEVTPQHAPVPIAAKSVVEQVMDFVKQVIETGADAERAARDFLARHPELVDALQAAAVTAIAATIIEDIATAGIGLIDDPLIIGICAKLIQVARAVKAGTLVLVTP